MPNFVHRAKLVQIRRARGAWRDERERVEITATRADHRCERRAHSHAEQADALDTRLPKEIDGVIDRCDPRRDSVILEIATCRVARAVIVEAKHGKTEQSEARGEVPIRAMRTEHLVTEWRTQHDAHV